MNRDNEFLKYQYERLVEIAIGNHGKCLSKRYLAAKKKVKLKCKFGHVWQATPDHIYSGKWCPACAINKSAELKRATIKDMQRIAKSRNGDCLSTSYKNGGEKLLWKCEFGHKWEAVPESIKAGSWCPICSGNSFSPKERLSELKEIALQRKGRCLSKEYKGANSKLSWKCSSGHEWSAVPSSIKSGSWCPECARANSGVSQKSSLQEMKVLAKKRGGECSSTVYINSQTKLAWKCHFGHQWTAVPAAIKYGTWCPHCNFNIGEELCRSFFESVFERDFPKVRPSFLTYKGQRLELDGYCEELGLAFEHQGLQHYKAYKFFGGRKNYLKIKERDYVKKQLCRKNGVTLFEVKDLVNLVKYKNIADYLIELLETERVEFDIDRVPKSLHLGRVFSQSHELKRLQSIAEMKDGKLCSRFYLGANIKLEWKCKNGHKWFAAPSAVKHTKNRKGTWCPKCSKQDTASKLKSDLSEFQKIAEAKSGKCISNTYVNSQSKLEWQCSKGHKWSAVAGSVRQGTWCPTCAIDRKGASQRGSLEECQKIARSRGGRCISLSYTNSQTKLKWECKKKHRWFARPSDVKTTKSKKGTWCPFCAKKSATSH